MASLFETLRSRMGKNAKEKHTSTEKYYAKTRNGKKIISLSEHLTDCKPFAEGLWPHQILLLSKITSLTKKNANIESYWWRECGMKDEDVEEQIRFLRNEGLLEPMGAFDLLMLDTAKELKEIAEVYGLSQNGKKADLANRICSYVSSEEIRDLYYTHPYVCSEAGQKLIHKYEMIPYIHKKHYGGLTIWELAESVPAGQEENYKSIVWDILCQRSEKKYNERRYEEYTAIRFDMGDFLLEEDMAKRALHFLLEGIMYEIYGLDNHGVCKYESVLAIPIAHIRLLKQCLESILSSDNLQVLLAEELQDITIPGPDLYSFPEKVSLVEALVRNDRKTLKRIYGEISHRK